jgi:hypothetical protein
MPQSAKERMIEWRERPYVSVSCSEGDEHAPHGNEGQMRRDIWASGRFRGGRSEAVEWLGDFRPLLPPSSPQIWSNEPPPRGEVVDQDCVWSGIGSEYSNSEFSFPSSQVKQNSCVYFFLGFFFDN